MKKLSELQLESVNGGGPFKEWYTDIRDFVNNNLADLCQGIKDGWNSLQNVFDNIIKYIATLGIRQYDF